MTKSLYIKIVLTTLTIMFVSGLFAFIFSNAYYQQTLKPLNDEKNTKIALSIANYAKEEQKIERYFENIAAMGYQLLLIDEQGDKKYFGDSFRNEELPSTTLNKVFNGEVYHGIAGFPQETFVTGFFANELTNTIGVPLLHDDKTYALFVRPNIKLLFNEIHLLFAWLLLFMIILSIILVFISTKYIINPIIELKDATKKLSKGDFSVKLEINREDEIGELAKSFTFMSEQLKKLDEMKNEFIGNISRDIQTPLSNIKGYSNLLGEHVLTREEKNYYRKIINTEINRLSSLTKQLLLLSSIDQQESHLKKSCFSLSKQLKEVTYHYQWLINEKDIMISYSLSDTIIYGNESLLYSVWENLLTNAIKYNKEFGMIDLSVIETSNYIDVSFKDSGIGMSKHVTKRILERFYREDISRTNRVEGTGLGLSIVDSIVKLHDGKIQINSEKNLGTTITVSIPRL